MSGKRKEKESPVTIVAKKYSMSYDLGGLYAKSIGVEPVLLKYNFSDQQEPSLYRDP